MRLQMVKELQGWVCKQLNPKQPKFIENNGTVKVVYAARKEGDIEKKAKQYVIEHLALGKMLYPLKNDDPLFTMQSYDDESMKIQLKPNQYRMFQEQVQLEIAVFNETNFDDAKEVTWKDVNTTLSENNKVVLKKLQDKLTKNTLVALGEADDTITNQMISLVLRYQCLDAFENNFHASIPKEWKTEFNDFTECFASPLNNKLDNYFSMFEEDKIFGSRGNFFTFLSKNNNSLPDGKYEMNPPWMNPMYEFLQNVIKNSVQSANVQVILIGPSWTGTKWIPGIDSIFSELPSDYANNSYHSINRIGYVQDANDQKLTLNTKIWVFSHVPISDGIRNILSTPSDG